MSFSRQGPNHTLENSIRRNMEMYCCVELTRKSFPPFTFFG